ncbi:MULTISPECIES: hypothetical protein [Bacteroidota]|uniref:hypothetical protein n=1 Tax=Polaribacter sp. TaxID=1920175 RepID=UPI0040488E18
MKNIAYILIILFQFQFVIGQEDAIYISNDKQYGELKNGLPEQDSIIELTRKGITIGKGAVAISKNGISNLKVGYWKEYYESGILKMEGNYNLGSYVSCCMGGACRTFHYYRTGLWKFYNDNGKLNYELTFEPTEFYIDTTCEGGDKLLFGIIKEIPLKYWGDLTSDKVFELQKIKNEEDDFTEIWTPLNGRIFIEIIKKSE